MSKDLLILYFLTNRGKGRPENIYNILPDILKDIPKENIDIFCVNKNDFDIYIRLWEHCYVSPLKYIVVIRRKNFNNKNFNNNYIYFHNWLTTFCIENSLKLYLI